MACRLLLVIVSVDIRAIVHMLDDGDELLARVCKGAKYTYPVTRWYFWTNNLITIPASLDRRHGYYTD